MSATVQAIEFKEVERRVAELSQLTGVQLKLEKSKHLECYHVHSFENGRWMGFVIRDKLSEIGYWMNVMIALEGIRRDAQEEAQA